VRGTRANGTRWRQPRRRRRRASFMRDQPAGSLRDPLAGGRDPPFRRRCEKATFEGVSHYLRVLGVELPTFADPEDAPSSKPYVRFTNRLGKEEGLFICANLDEAEAWFDDWCKRHPLASAGEIRGASCAAKLLNTVDLDGRLPDARFTFFKLDDRGNLSPRPCDPHYQLLDALTAVGQLSFPELTRGWQLRAWSMESNDALPSGSQLACPRCGNAPGAGRFCGSCGLNLELQAKLPTADAYANRVRQRRRLVHRDAPIDPIQASSPRKARYYPATELPPGSPSQWPRVAIVIGAATVAVTLAAGVAVVLIDNSSGDHVDPRAARTDSRTLHSAPSRRTSENGTATSEQTASSPKSSSRKNPTARTPGAPGIRATLKHYWRKLERHKPSSAYADLSPKLQSDPAVGSEPVWVARKKWDPLQKVILRVRPRKLDKRTGQADIVRLRTKALQSGCKEWSGTYGLIRSGGRWLIDSVSRSQRSC
jgi:hypothetical protein